MRHEPVIKSLMRYRLSWPGTLSVVDQLPGFGEHYFYTDSGFYCILCATNMSWLTLVFFSHSCWPAHHPVTSLPSPPMPGPFFWRSRELMLPFWSEYHKAQRCTDRSVTLLDKPGTLQSIWSFVWTPVLICRFVILTISRMSIHGCNEY